MIGSGMVPEWFRNGSELVPNHSIRVIHRVDGDGVENEAVEFKEGISQSNKGISPLRQC